jgi:GTP pyrophosphokinase
MGKSYTPFSADKMYTYLKGYAMGADMEQTLLALAFARDKHSGQLRKDGEPYIIHPLTMACNAIALEIRDDYLIAAILLHDVVEDCNIDT